MRITNVPADAHSRLPGYLRGRVGTVERVFEGDYAYFCPHRRRHRRPDADLHRRIPARDLWARAPRTAR